MALPERAVGATVAIGYGSKKLLALECGVLFFVLPMSLYLIRLSLAFKIMPLIMLIGIFSWWYLHKVEGVRLWHPQGLIRITGQILAVFVPAAVLLTVAAWYVLPQHFFTFPRLNTLMWGGVMLLYPLFAAAPQELFFRAYFFRRYQSLFPDYRLMILANAASFGLAHLFYGNWVAPVFSTIGGLLFAYRYWRTNSVLAVTVEHGIWGNYLFTIGYGWYFYSGNIQ